MEGLKSARIMPTNRREPETIMTASSASLATALADAHRQRRQLDAATLSAPASNEAALGVHTAYAQALGAEIGGWKVAVTPGGDVVGAPIFAKLFVADGATVTMPPQGPIGIEVEIALRLKQDLPARASGYTRQEILAATGAVMVGIEILESRIKDFKQAPFPLFVADLMANRGYVPGREIADFAKIPFDKLRCTLKIAGKTVHDAVGGHVNGDPLVPAVAFASRPAAYLGGFRKGQIVTLGSMCGLIPTLERGLVEAEIEQLGRLSITLA
jgi:2-keto-4-pentenoate hydratase